jgi:hypothetical protein
MTDEPACWSWPVPPLRDLDAEIEATIAARAHLPVDRTLSAGAYRMMLRGGAEELRWREFHTGVRLADDPDAPERCAMCGSSWGRRMVDDHCHFTGLIRGWLHPGCNITEGAGVRDITHLYRERFPALILGYRRWYTGRGWPLNWWADERQARRLTCNPAWTAEIALGATYEPDPDEGWSSTAPGAVGFLGVAGQRRGLIDPPGVV